jgi:site-specific recombinase XerD
MSASSATAAPGPGTALTARRGALPPALARDLEQAAAYAAAGTAPSTRRAYAADWRRFTAWCAGHGLDALPASPGAVAAFLAAEAGQGRVPSTLGRRLAAIRAAHLRAGHEPPSGSEAVRATLRGIRRTVGVAPVKKAPATTELVRRMVDACDAGTLGGLRDRALLLLGFAGAFRRGELVALDAPDLEEVAGGLRVRVRRSKTDQEGQGTVVPVRRGSAEDGRYCPVRAVQAWMRAAGITTGPVFRPLWRGGPRTGPRPRDARLSDGSVAAIVKGYAARVGADPARFAAHSLRAGFLTSAAGRGASLWKLRDVSRHRSVDTLAGYVRDADLFTEHAGDGLL